MQSTGQSVEQHTDAQSSAEWAQSEHTQGWTPVPWESLPVTLYANPDTLAGEHYYFDTLPLHPRPLPLESVTSWLTRLGEKNGFTSIAALAQVCAARRGRDSDGIVLRMADMPQKSWGFLARATACPPAQLAGTTFYYLMKHFGRLTQPQAAGRFLSGAVAPTLRYCPLCLAGGQVHGSSYSQAWLPGAGAGLGASDVRDELWARGGTPSDSTAYYPLSWRFKMLRGCPLHGCRLLGACPRCAKALPLLSASLKLCVCYFCGGDLRDCGSTALTHLSDAEVEEARLTLMDLECILQPQPQLAMLVRSMGYATLGSYIGERLCEERVARGIYRPEISHAIRSPLNSVGSIEGSLNSAEGRGVKFRYFMQYARYMGTSLHALLATCGSPQLVEYSVLRMSQAPLPHRRAYPGKPEKAPSASPGNLSGTPETEGTQETPAPALALRLQKRLELRERVHARLAEGKGKPVWHDRILLVAVDQAIVDLRVSKRPLTVAAIAQLVGYTRGTLMYYPDVRARLYQHIATLGTRKRKRKR